MDYDPQPSDREVREEVQRTARAAHRDPRVMQMLVDNETYVSRMAMLGVARQRAIELRESMSEQEAMASAATGGLRESISGCCPGAALTIPGSCRQQPRLLQ